MLKQNGTFNCDINTQSARERYRAQATGIGQTRAAAQANGERRAGCVIDGAPSAQLQVADLSYPAPGPCICPLTGRLLDRITGGAWRGVDWAGGPVR